VIDGIAYTNPEGKEFFDNLDATMVDNISILKDAAASVYGARGANGVVLVTTKRGKPGKPRINYTGSYGELRTCKDML
jgi:TonB-dependent SusC/RagA subfamily outer membrane receptor